jgi:uncharacterized protein YndB with AHSA1/START domain
MTTVARVEPVRKQIVIDASQAHVFKTFCEGIDRWWPREHHIGQSPMKRAVLEGRAGGRWYHECEDGTECDTGKVLTWEPPRRLVLTWQINGEWQYDPNFITEIEVTFTAEGPKKTRVDLEHRGLARFGVAAEQTRAMLDSPGGWGQTLASLAKAALE